MDLKAYLANIPAGRKPRFESIRQLVKKLYPEAEESMRYKMPTFESQLGWVAIANQKNYISVYTCMAKHIAGFKARHPGIKTGTACINFRDKDEIPLDDLKQVITNAIEYRH